MRRACIDIGSNTTRLLVADDAPTGLTIVCEEKSFTRIGAALADDDTIPAVKRAEVVAVVAGQLARARSLGVTDVLGVATAAVRRAANRDALLAELRAGAGLEIVVLSAAHEARLAFRGAAGMLDGPAPDPLGVLDVGGGSSEVVVGRPGGAIAWWASLPFGSGTLASAHLHHDPPTAHEIDCARSAVATAIGALAFDGPAPARTLAVGGSATSLGRLAGSRLDPPALGRALELLCALPAAGVATRYAIDPARARLLPAGLVVLEALGGRLEATIEVGRGGVREGVLLEAVAR